MSNDKLSDSIAIHVEPVSKDFGIGAESIRALDDVTLDVGENESFAPLGPSGCGKTTLLRLVAGFEELTEGLTAPHGKRLTGLPRYRCPVNTAFQNYESKGVDATQEVRTEGAS